MKSVLELSELLLGADITNIFRLNIPAEVAGVEVALLQYCELDFLVMVVL